MNNHKRPSIATLSQIVCFLLTFPAIAAAQSAPVYRSSNLVMGYVRPGQPANVTGYSQCFTSIGDYLWVRSDNSANIHPLFEVTVVNSSVVINKNGNTEGTGAYVCHNNGINREEITAGTVASGTTIGQGLSCVVTIANFVKARQNGGTVPGSVSCAYDSASGRITATATQAGQISECNYVCAKPSTTKTTQVKSARYQQVLSGTDNIGANLNCAKGTNYFFSICSTAGVTTASYERATGVVTKGSASGCSNGSHSYFCAAAPKTQCADGIDNDNDTLIDAQDPGCWSNPSNPASYDPNRIDESAATTQCQDGIDNDGDGAIDMGDFSCSSPTDNDETNPRAQCQDGIDNDSDGAIDLADFSCSSKQDNDESLPKSQCQDGLDNDNDGAIDILDPGCASSQDNDESGEPTKVSIGVECVFDNQDGSYTAYFGYDNTSGTLIEVPVAAAAPSKNEVSPGNPQRGQVTQFKPGRNKGAFAVVFDGQPLTWSVRAPGSSLSKATAARNSTPCARLEPIAECINGTPQGVTATFGYKNPNDFALTVPVGALNFFSPAPTNRGQPTQLLAGLNKGAFATLSATGLTWKLDGLSATVTSSTPVCPGGCVDTPIGTVKNELDQVALDLADLTNKAAKQLGSIAMRQVGQSRLSSASAAAMKKDADRAAKKAAALAKKAQSLTIALPEVVRSCPFLEPFCESVDRAQTIEALKGLYAQILNQLKRIRARQNFKLTGNTNRGDTFVRDGKQLQAAGNEQLSKLPRIATVCK